MDRERAEEKVSKDKSGAGPVPRPAPVPGAAPGRGGVLITGASSGIGLALARRFAAERPQEILLLAGRSESALAEAARSCRDLGCQDVRWYSVDLARPEGAKDLYQAVTQDGNTVHTLVNNAGASFSGLFKDLSAEQLESMLTLNIAAATMLVHYFLPSLIAHRGRLLQVSSTGAFQPGPYTAVYYAGKAYIHSWSLALARELRPEGVRVSILAPGAVASAFSRRAGKADVKTAMTPEAVASYTFSRFMKGKRLIIPGAFNRLMIVGSKILPGSASAAIVERIQRPLVEKKGRS